MLALQVHEPTQVRIHRNLLHCSLFIQKISGNLLRCAAQNREMIPRIYEIQDVLIFLRPSKVILFGIFLSH
jgi:hypothetical protein